MPDDTLLADLKQQIAHGQICFIVGAGVSVGATGNSKVNGHAVATWPGLLHHGVERCATLHPNLGMDWSQRVHEEIDSKDLDEVLSAAEKVHRKLGAPSGGEFRSWLRDSVGKLQVTNTGVIKALEELGGLLATTNYDLLLTQVTDLAPVSWREESEVERVLRKDDRGILHLHGHWKQPESVILGIRDYERILNDAHAQWVLRVLQGMRTVVFVGCGEGLRDPNFDALLSWTGKIFAQSEYRRYRLALDAERDKLQKEHPPEQRLFVLGYGADHGALETFLRRLAPAAESPANPVSVALTAPAVPYLPPRPALCLGREREVEDLVLTLAKAAPEPTPILGPGGIGKSTVSLAALYDERVVNRHGARRWFVRCDSISNRPALAAGIGTALGLEITPRIEAAAVARLAELPGILVLDNFETPWETDMTSVEELLARLAGIPRLALVVSLRGLQRPLGILWRDAIQPPALPLRSAREIFLAIAGANFAHDPHLDDLLRAQDGVPGTADSITWRSRSRFRSRVPG